jgi:hypothetical protein
MRWRRSGSLSVLSQGEYEALLGLVEQARRELHGRVIWNVNSTAKGGGVVEMLRPLLGYCRGADVDARWAVISGESEFFAITKRIHNRLHGFAGDGGPLGDAERDVYERTLAASSRGAGGACASDGHRDLARSADGRVGGGGARDGGDGDVALPRRSRRRQRSCS